MKRLLAMSLALLLISASPLIAGSRGFGGVKRSLRPSTPPRTLQKPVQPKTGTVKDLGVKPTSKSPIDSVKGRSTTTPGPVAGAGTPQAAPAPASSWFGSSWMNWAILGYLFGRHTAPTPEQARIKEREKAKKAEEAKQKEQAKETEQLKSKEQDTKKEQIKETDEVKSEEAPKDQTRPAAPTDSRLGI